VTDTNPVPDPHDEAKDVDDTETVVERVCNFDGDCVDDTLELRLTAGDALYDTDPLDVLDCLEDPDVHTVLEADTESDTEAEAECEGDPEYELVFVRNRLDSELQGLGDRLGVSLGDMLSERLPEAELLADAVCIAVLVLVAIFDTDKDGVDEPDFSAD